MDLCTGEQNVSSKRPFSHIPKPLLAAESNFSANFHIEEGKRPTGPWGPHDLLLGVLEGCQGVEHMGLLVRDAHQYVAQFNLPALIRGATW